METDLLWEYQGGGGGLSQKCLPSAMINPLDGRGGSREDYRSQDFGSHPKPVLTQGNGKAGNGNTRGAGRGVYAKGLTIGDGKPSGGRGREGARPGRLIKEVSPLP